jgi:hypothetical protein
MTSGVFYDLMLLRLTGLLVICVIADRDSAAARACR